MTFLAANPDYNEVALSNANPANWTWVDHAQWIEPVQGSPWQVFAHKWRNSEVLVQEDPAESMLDNLALPGSDNDSFMIRNCYVEAEKLVWKRAIAAPMTGVILSGQPGIGKTLFIWFLLVRLLSMKQVVVLHIAGGGPTGGPILFYHDAVYTASSAAGGSTLPVPRTGLKRPTFIWSLFDLERGNHPPLALYPQCFPVQAPSPNPERFSGWRKVRSPFFTYFPLWSRNELRSAVRTCPGFTALWSSLDTMVRNGVVDVISDSANLQSPGLFKYLREIYPETLPGSTDEVFDSLLDGLIGLFGFIPRAVFQALFCGFNSQVDMHDVVFSIGIQKLRTTVLGIVANPAEKIPDVESPSHRLVAIDNVGSLELPELRLQFKSEYIGIEISRRLSDKFQSWDDVYSLIKDLLEIPQAKGLAGNLFEPLAHYSIMNPNNVCHHSPWVLQPMTLVNGTNPKFIFQPDAKAIIGFPKVKRHSIFFNQAINELLLDNNAYYIPNATNHPFFDSFIVHLDFDARSACLWLLQMTTSDLHRGSSKGYVVIQNIIKHILNLLTNQLPAAKKLKLATKKGKEKAKELKLATGKEKWKAEEAEEPKHAIDKGKKAAEELQIAADKGKRKAEEAEEPKLATDKGKRKAEDAEEPSIVVHYVVVRPENLTDDPDLLTWALPEGWDSNIAQINHQGCGYLLKYPLA